MSPKAAAGPTAKVASAPQGSPNRPTTKTHDANSKARAIPLPAPQRQSVATKGGADLLDTISIYLGLVVLALLVQRLAPDAYMVTPVLDQLHLDCWYCQPV